jgi:hypothetical protein
VSKASIGSILSIPGTLEQLLGEWTIPLADHWIQPVLIEHHKPIGNLPFAIPHFKSIDVPGYTSHILENAIDGQAVHSDDIGLAVRNITFELDEHISDQMRARDNLIAMALDHPFDKILHGAVKAPMVVTRARMVGGQHHLPIEAIDTPAVTHQRIMYLIAGYELA